MALLSPLPLNYQNTTAQWAFLSYDNPLLATIPGSFNRSVFVSPSDIIASDYRVIDTIEYLNSTDFIAYDDKFFELIGANATIERVHDLPFQTHEAPCFDPLAKLLFFVEWGPPGGHSGTHTWQYLLNTETNELRNITTTPPLYNGHGCTAYNGSFYVVTDGSSNETASLNRINPNTLEKTMLLNNFYGQPFEGLNDLDVDGHGNFWMTDDHYGWGRGLVDYAPVTLSTVYIVNGSTMRPRPFHLTSGNANGIAVFDGSNSEGLVYISDTGAAPVDPNASLDPYQPRTLKVMNVTYPGAVIKSERLLSIPISFVYDGIRVSKNGWIFGAAGNGVDIIHPENGQTLGTIRVGGGNYVAVNVAFGQNELWIVGAGGIWHVSNISETLAREL